MPSQIKGGIERIMIYKDGKWQQQVGSITTAVGENVQRLAQERFNQDKKTMPNIEINERDVKMFNDIEAALSLSGKNNQQQALEDLYSGENAKYTKEQIDAALAINKEFDNIVKDMAKDNLLVTKCTT